MSYPPQLQRLHSALLCLPGVTGISSGIQSLQGISADDLRFPDFATLPIGAIRRTLGGLDAEALIQVEFEVSPSDSSWQTIEFLAWFIRDQARAGLSIQLRPFALPPEVAGQVQIGHTLRWHLDLFCSNTAADLSPQLQQVERVAQTLEAAIQVYGSHLEIGVKA
ncbi:hypothetical protein [Iodobacter fluviatilis]|uniref:Uncharacterized protein n=1 Tax=Iodobacter fluviatilis TaxID=537 RepID=A0A377Q990_9NEIS|nr:hypothetical protein [Iodobacter fluviatilis]TCU88799.1 hypothetical protein EV682_103383 [Iodobacter fluviatilis]STQ91129.1 Uncharacterised protein [Iodobacter fluviatilis]